MIDVLFDPNSLPDLLTELAVSDEANKRAVAVQVVQRPGGGLVRAVVLAPEAELPRGATVLSEQRHSLRPIDPAAFQGVVMALTSPPIEARLLETGIKAIDVLCPLTAGGTAAIAGEAGAGATVVMEELVRRLSGGSERVSLFAVLQTWEGAPPDYSYAETLKKDGFSEGTKGAVQTFFLRGDDGPWTESRLAGLAPADAVIHLSRAMAAAKIYPCIDPRTSHSRLLDSNAISPRHRAVALGVREALSALWAGRADERARKLANYLTQPFFCADPWTRQPGSYVSLTEALDDCAAILDGRHDDLPAEAFYFGGSVAELRARPREA